MAVLLFPATFLPFQNVVLMKRKKNKQEKMIIIKNKKVELETVLGDAALTEMTIWSV